MLKSRDLSLDYAKGIAKQFLYIVVKKNVPADELWKNNLVKFYRKVVF